MIIGQEDEGGYALRLAQSALFKSLTGRLWYYRADDDDMILVVETNRTTLYPRRVMSLDKFTPKALRESELNALFKRRLDEIELAHGAYWNSQECVQSPPTTCPHVAGDRESRHRLLSLHSLAVSAPSCLPVVIAPTPHRYQESSLASPTNQARS